MKLHMYFKPIDNIDTITLELDELFLRISRDYADLRGNINGWTNEAAAVDHAHKMNPYCLRQNRCPLNVLFSDSPTDR